MQVISGRSLPFGACERHTDPLGLRLPRYSGLVMTKINVQIRTISKKLVNRRTSLAAGEQESEGGLRQRGCFVESTPGLCFWSLFDFFGVRAEEFLYRPRPESTRNANGHFLSENKLLIKSFLKIKRRIWIQLVKYADIFALLTPEISLLFISSRGKVHEKEELIKN